MQHTATPSLSPLHSGRPCDIPKPTEHLACMHDNVSALQRWDDARASDVRQSPTLLLLLASSIRFAPNRTDFLQRCLTLPDCLLAMSRRWQTQNQFAQLSATRRADVDGWCLCHDSFASYGGVACSCHLDIPDARKSLTPFESSCSLAPARAHANSDGLLCICDNSCR
eukprot:4981346-Karenia_brevis.AAC.1